MTWLRWPGSRKVEERELDEELDAHLEIEARVRTEAGDDPADAALAARRLFGNVTRIREETREAWGWSRTERFCDDVRYGLRMLLKSPGWTAVMCATLALGIGLSTAIFSLTYGLLVRALPYPESGRLVTLWLTNSAAAAANVPRFNANAANWLDWRAGSRLLSDIALTRAETSFNLTGNGQPERV